MKDIIDIESRATGDDHLSVRLWLRLLACTNMIEARISSGLRETFGTTLPRFDFLSQLERNPKGLRMTEISERMMVTGGNVTRIAADLEADGLIARAPQPGDRRAVIVTLTAAGRRSFAEMATVHEEWIIEILSGLRTTERTSLFAQLATLKRRLSEPRSPFR